MHPANRSRGFSIAEVVLALGLVCLVILGVALLALSIIRSRTESSDRAVTTTAAAQLLDDLAVQAQEDDTFWDTDYTTTPYKEGDIRIGKLDYHYKLKGFTVVDPLSTPVGNALPKNRLKLLELEVSWFDTEQTDNKQGYGKLSTSVTKLVSQSEGDS